MDHENKIILDFFRPQKSINLRFFTFYIKNILTNHARNTIKGHLFSAIYLTTKFNISLTTLPTMVGKTSKAFLASILRASASLFNNFLKFIDLLMEVLQRQHVLLHRNLQQQLKLSR